MKLYEMTGEHYNGALVEFETGYKLISNLRDDTDEHKLVGSRTEKIASLEERIVSQLRSDGSKFDSDGTVMILDTVCDGEQATAYLPESWG